MTGSESPRHRPDDERLDLPHGIAPTGVPRPRDGHQAFVVTLAVILALLALTFTLGWVVFHRLVSG